MGLADHGRPQGFLTRQVERWRSQFEAAYTRDLPQADRLYAALSARIPADPEPGIVHGDYRLDNLLMDRQDQPAALVDWELSTIGDSLNDLALMLVYGQLAELSPHAVSDVRRAPGFLSEQEMIERYVTASGRDLGNLRFYLGLASYKLAGILEGVHFRYLNGQTVGAGFAEAGEGVDPLLTAGLRALEE